MPLDCDQNQFVFRLGRMNGRKLPKARHGCRCFYWRSIDKHLHLTSHFRNLRTPRNAPRPTRQLSRNDKTTPRPLFYDFKIRESGSSFLKKEKKKLKILLRLTFRSFIFRKRQKKKKEKLFFFRNLINEVMLVSIDMSERERKRKKDIPSNNSFTERANPSRFLKKISTFFVKWRRQAWKYNRVIYTLIYR